MDSEKKQTTGKIESLIIFKCNCRCVMCSTGLQIDRSQNNDCYQSMRPYKDIIKDIDKAVKMGAKGFAFSGGEATLRKDLPLLVRYAQISGLDHIEVQSNGKMYVYEAYCRKLIKAGVNNFVISFHSCQEDIQDKIMGVPGTYKQAVQGMKNLNKLGQKLKINIVLTKFNYDHLEETVKFLFGFDIAEIRFTMCMLEGNAAINPKAIVAKMNLVAPEIVKSIKIINNRFGSYIYNMVPCLLPGCEKYINDMGQMDTILIGPDFEASLDEERKGKKIKIPGCKKCIYDKICYGVWKKYAKVFGLDEIKPVKR